MTADPAPVNPLAARQGPRHLGSMPEKDMEREDRLAAALRENLRRRKAQARLLAEEPPKEREGS